MNGSINTYKSDTKNQPIPVIANVNKAQKLIGEKKYEEAEQILQEALLISDKQALVYKYLGICREHFKDFNQALDLYNKSAKLDPQDKQIWYRIGMMYMNLGDFKKSEESFKQADKVYPVNTDIYMGWGMSLMKQKRYNEAYEKFIYSLQINRYNLTAIFMCALIEIRLEKYDDAQAKLEFLMTTNPNENVTYELANLNYIKENYEKAIDFAQKSITYNPLILPSYLLLGKIYSILLDFENSEKYFELAEEKELKNPLLYVEWGNALCKFCKFEKAKEIYEKAQDDEDALLGIALCNAELGNIDEAKSFIKNHNSNNLFTSEIKGIIEYNNGNFKQAITNFKNALKSNVPNHYDYYRLANCYKKINDKDMAKDSFEKLIKAYDKFTFGYLEYAKYLIELNDFKEANRKLQKANRLDENNQEILNLLFFVNYKLVKENICEYNIREALSIADKIESFEHPELKQELNDLLRNLEK